MLPDPSSRLSAHTNVWTEKCEESFEIRMLKIMQTTCIACPDIKIIENVLCKLIPFCPTITIIVTHFNCTFYEHCERK